MRGHERRHFETFSRAWEQYVSEFRKARSVSVMSLRSERPVSRPRPRRQGGGSRSGIGAIKAWIRNQIRCHRAGRAMTSSVIRL